jgi:hypothetical protein
MQSVTRKHEPQESQVLHLRERIVEFRQMLHTYAGTASESFIREHIQQLQKRIQHLLNEPAINHSAPTFGEKADFQEG